MKKQTWNAQEYKTTGSFVTNYGNDLVKLLDPKSDELILDLGCGTGKLSNDIANFAKKAYGTDYSENMINLARESYPNIDFKVGDAQQDLDYPNEYFDAVFSNAALHWMLQADKVIKNVNKVLKHGGRFVFEMGGKGNIGKLLNSLDKASQKYNLEDYKIKNYYPSISEYTAILENNGFIVKYALLFERPTLLEGNDGFKNWVKVFRTELIANIKNLDEFLDEAEKIAKPDLYKDGKWFADYVRLRVIAYKI